MIFLLFFDMLWKREMKLKFKFSEREMQIESESNGVFLNPRTPDSGVESLPAFLRFSPPFCLHLSEI